MYGKGMYVWIRINHQPTSSNRHVSPPSQPAACMRRFVQAAERALALLRAITMPAMGEEAEHAAAPPQQQQRLLHMLHAAASAAAHMLCAKAAFQARQWQRAQAAFRDVQACWQRMEACSMQQELSAAALDEAPAPVQALEGPVPLLIRWATRTAACRLSRQSALAFSARLSDLDPLGSSS